MNFIKKQLAWLTDQALCLLVSFLTGVRPKQAAEYRADARPKVYYANHGSHGDFMMVWVSLPRRLRMNIRPVAGADYWLTGRLKTFVIRNVFNALLIPRNSGNPQAVTEQMSEALQQGSSLIIFPEGTRNTDENTVLLPFKTGIYHLAAANPAVEFVPVWIENINRVLPKGKILPVPLLCHVHFGDALTLREGEEKTDFLERSRNALLALAPDTASAATAQETSS
ncbi:lysophospholipid acyltransferase family protein [Neisseria sp.]|uniref:lysophospholipid acyltransferase family protein n=1 Tax=Neisseria sp. TaxID=192066 RepID=UPI0035A0359C